MRTPLLGQELKLEIKFGRHSHCPKKISLLLFENSAVLRFCQKLWTPGFQAQHILAGHSLPALSLFHLLPGVCSIPELPGVGRALHGLCSAGWSDPWKPWEEVPVGAAFLAPRPSSPWLSQCCWWLWRSAGSIVVVAREVQKNSPKLSSSKKTGRAKSFQQWSLELGIRREETNSPRVNVSVSGFWKVSVVLLSFLTISLLVSKIFFAVDLIDPYSINEQLPLSDDTFLYLVWNSGLSG